MNKWNALTIFTLVFFFPLSLRAQEAQDFLDDWLTAFSDITSPTNTGLTLFPILEISPGGLRANLANAYTAIAGDVSFFESNPAASSILQNTELAFFHRSLISDVSLDSVFFTQRYKEFGYGFGAKFLHFEFTALDGRGNQLASATPAEILFTANASYNLFANYDFTGIAVGLNLKLAYRAVPPELYSHIFTQDVNAQDFVGVMADVGILSRFNFLKLYSSREKNFSIGFSALNLGPAVKNEALPSEIRFGISYGPFAFLTIAADLSYMMNLVDLSKSEGLGFAAGLDFHFVDFFSIQGGMELRGNNPRFSIGANIALEAVTFQINYTLDLSSSLNSLDNFSVGAVINFGDERRAEIQKEVDRIYIQALLALSEGNFSRVLELCDQIIDPLVGLDPNFTPAQKTRAVVAFTIQREEEFTQFEKNREDLPPLGETE